MRRIAAVLALALTLACARAVGREAWQRMSRDEKTLYVRQLLGHEQAQRSKGGHARRFPEPAEAYVARIDAAYAHGETRSVDAVFETLGE